MPARLTNVDNVGDQGDGIEVVVDDVGVLETVLGRVLEMVRTADHDGRHVS